MSPTFTSGRLKSMMIPIENLADSTIEFIAQKVKENPEIDLKPMMQYFSIDVICKVAFGMDTKCRLEADPEMFKLFTGIVEDFKFDTYPKATIWAILSHFPELLSKLGFWPASMLKIKTMTKDIMKEREEQNIKIGDFVDRLMEYKKVAELPITDEMIEAQGMVFMIAGFETTANTLGSMCYQVAKHQDIQERIVEEILDTIGSDEITHENISNLEYLEACIMEDLRLCGPATEHDRVCVKDSIVKGIKIKKGVRIQMPTTAAHLDSEFFPEPEKFKPERFLKENADNIIPYTWRPFGSGNRVCIGQRFAMMEMKIILAKLLSKFKLTLTEKSGLEEQMGTFALFQFNTSYAKLELRN
jgi:cytochrome P450 family 3 subfamily A